MRKDVLAVMLIFLQDEQGYGGGDQDANMEDGIGARDLVEPGSRQAVDHGVYDTQGCHDASDMALGRLVPEVGAN